MDSKLIAELINHDLGHRVEGLEKQFGVRTFKEMASIDTGDLRRVLYFNRVEVEHFESLRDICIDKIQTAIQHQPLQQAEKAHLPPTTATAKVEAQLAVAEAYITGAERLTRGIGLIFINKKFRDQGERKGATIDGDNFGILFKQMGLKFTLCMDYTCQQIRQKILETTLMDFTRCEMLAVGISTHGDDGDQLYGYDGPCSLYEDILLPFKPINCPGLTRKPKVFFIQSCRSRKEDQISGNNTEKPCVDIERDFLLAHSTVWGYKAFRHIKTGSWFITTLREVFEKYRDTHNLEDILTLVNQLVIKKSQEASEQSELVQTCEFVSELTKPLFFHK